METKTQVSTEQAGRVAQDYLHFREVFSSVLFACQGDLGTVPQIRSVRLADCLPGLFCDYHARVRVR